MSSPLAPLARPAALDRLVHAVRLAQRTYEQALHGRRRRAALLRIGNGAMPAAVLMVCEGNIFRSPFAAALLASRLAPQTAARTEVRSAGFVGPGRGAPTEAMIAALARGCNLGAHRSSLIPPAAAPGHRLTFVMEARQKRILVRLHDYREEDVLLLGDLDPLPILGRDVRDPWGHPPHVLSDTYDRLVRCVDVLAIALNGRMGGAAGRRVVDLGPHMAVLRLGLPNARERDRSSTPGA